MLRGDVESHSNDVRKRKMTLKLHSRTPSLLQDSTSLPATAESGINQTTRVYSRAEGKKKHGTRSGAVLTANLLLLLRFYLPAISKLTLASSFAFTVTFCVVLPSFCCQTSTV